MTHVLIFGSNEDGFHGAGTAGYAMRRDFRNNWRTDMDFIQAMHMGKGARGVFAQFGVGRGIQEGYEGFSYAIATVTKPGARRSISLDNIQDQVDQLIRFMQAHPDTTFCLTKFGAGLAGNSNAEMAPMWEQILSQPNARWAKIKRNDTP